MRPRHNGWRSSDEIFKHVFFNENVNILIEIGQICSWASRTHCFWKRLGVNQATSLQWSQRWLSPMTHKCINQPQWVWIGLDLFNDDTRPSGHISHPTKVDVSQSCFNSLNKLLKLNYVVQVWGLVEHHDCSWMAPALENILSWLACPCQIIHSLDCGSSHWDLFVIILSDHNIHNLTTWKSAHKKWLLNIHRYVMLIMSIAFIIWKWQYVKPELVSNKYGWHGLLKIFFCLFSGILHTNEAAGGCPSACAGRCRQQTCAHNPPASRQHRG